LTYIEDDSTNGGTSFHCLDGVPTLALSEHRCVAQTVVVVEPSELLLKRIDVAKFHCLIKFINLIMASYQAPIGFGDTARILQADKEEHAHVQEVAQAYVKHFYNDKGDQLARVEESEAFQEVFDFHGDQKRRHKLARKLQQVQHNYDASTQLF
jgi:hypothetical protein